ncbi:hypothetical protein H6P81_010438 [Aristolochia fimbriata]|uniref:Uncharacterized protein n=1 Tax=Aristolochia fimbriata TaxID=158543 RepID=A0AAV7ENS2_ARIFI|nr:hypothetical protein H6P81_010438 [Aristolochia fimbriata]
MVRELGRLGSRHVPHIKRQRCYWSWVSLSKEVQLSHEPSLPGRMWTSGAFPSMTATDKPKHREAEQSHGYAEERWKETSLMGNLTVAIQCVARPNLRVQRPNLRQKKLA